MLHFLSSHDFSDPLKNSLPLSIHISSDLWLVSFKFFLKSIGNCDTFFLFEKNNPCIFPENINKTYRNSNPLLNLLINCVSARSAPQRLSIKDKCTFLFSIFLIIGLCNSSANCWSYIFSFSIPLPEVFFYQKIYKPLKQDPFVIHHI